MDTLRQLDWSLFNDLQIIQRPSHFDIPDEYLAFIPFDCRDLARHTQRYHPHRLSLSAGKRMLRLCSNWRGLTRHVRLNSFLFSLDLAFSLSFYIRQFFLELPYRIVMGRFQFP